VIAWRFIVALNALRVNGRLLLLSDMLRANQFGAFGYHEMIHSLPYTNPSNEINDLVHSMIANDGRTVPIEDKSLLIGATEAIKSINAKIHSLAQMPDPVLIKGEAGTGKEFFARLIAQRSNIHSIIIRIDCEALASARAGGGLPSSESLYGQISKILETDTAKNKPVTVLFTNINHLDLKTQSEILLFWEREWESLGEGNTLRRKTLRFIATSDMDLESLVQRNLFRKELYYRLNVIPVILPPLRERKADIPQLADSFVINACANLNRSFWLPTSKMLEHLAAYDWPGNLDELRITKERLAVSGDQTQILQQRGFHKLKKKPHHPLI
jgi:DNA-binding NtrC family response regulator